MLTREQETVVAVNEDLQNELGMYKSVMVPPDQKPRSNLIRVGRPPLITLTRSLNVGAVGEPIQKVSLDAHQGLPEAISGDLTLDEIS